MFESNEPGSIDAAPPSPALDCVHCADCIELLPAYPEHFFSVCVTDPPYNYEIAGHAWDEAEIARRVGRVQESSTLVKHMPYGSGLAGGVRNARWYERNRANVLAYAAWCESWGRAVFRVLRPGGFLLVFNSNRTVAQVQVAMESSGFYPRDLLVWRRHAGIPRGYNHANALRRRAPDEAAAWQGWQSCFMNGWEAVLLLQKPLHNNYAQTLAESGVGLLQVQDEDGAFRSNILEGFKKSPEERTLDHLTVKPLSLVRHLLECTLPPGGGHIVLDPFAGSGTTCVAARELGHRFVGVERESKHCELARKRLEEKKGNRGSGEVDGFAGRV
ncbi:MAG: site-specific DNA-methyltransferase [Candidatus Hydrogenedentes bacterium]|nr:site-specific DNA-methyltransferase [Candidatus Hydrogenedentota bacterium]